MKYLDEMKLNEIIKKSSGSVSVDDGSDKFLKIVICYLFWKRSTDCEFFGSDSLYRKVVGEISDRINTDLISESEKFDAESCVKLAESIELKKDFYAKISGDILCPSSVSETVMKIMNVSSEDVICDFGCGSGKFLLDISKNLQKKKVDVKLEGYEINRIRSLSALCLLEMNGIEVTVKEMNYLQENDSSTYEKGFVFPPFGLRYEQIEWKMLTEGYTDLFSSRMESEMLFILKALEHIKDGGKLIALVPKGVAFRKSTEKARKYLYENNLIEGIISLPAGILDYINIPVDLWILSKCRNCGIKFLNATEMKVAGSSSRDIQIDSDAVAEAYLKNPYSVDSREVEEHSYSFSQSSYLATDIVKSIPFPVHISEVCNIEKGSQYTLSRFKDQISEAPTDYQILTSANIQDGIVEYDKLPYIKEDGKLLKFKLEENDLVLTTKSTVVKILSVHNLPQRNIIVTGGMLIIRPDTNKINPIYLKMFLDSDIGKNELSSIAKECLILTISPVDFKNDMIVSCPPIEKQNELAGAYSKLVMEINELNKKISEMKNQIDNLFEESIKMN